jgi:ribose transport system permease protein
MAFAGELSRQGRELTSRIPGDPAAIRQALEYECAPIVVATTASSAPAVRSVVASIPALAGAIVLEPETYRWPTFLLPSNLRNIANQIAVIAILAVGMTLVIISGGIDLSVGSLIALSAVVAAGLVGMMGGEAAGAGVLLVAALAAIGLCALVGLFSGFVVTRFRVPPFIATLGMMQVASGIAYILSHGKPIYRLPGSSVALGRETDPLLGVPWAVWLMLVLYAAAHLVMSRTAFGRHVYAVGSNEEAARLAGVRVKRVLVAVYLGSGLLAGLGGVVTASQLKSGAPTYGMLYELYVIAAVVVGGTSLSGGEGKILGTLIGAFIIAVIQNGMNLANVESYTQKVVLGLVILGAVLLDRFKQRGLARRRGGPAGEGR